MPSSLKAKIIFDRIADRYDRHAIVSQKMGDALLARLDFIKINPRSILDLGTGTGHCLKALMARYPDARFTALDISQRMLAIARTKVDQIKVEWLCGDLFENALEERRFDLIVANNVLTSVDSIAGFFERCLAALNPDGLLLFSGLGVDTLKELKRAGGHVNHFYDMHDLGDALVHLGYTDPVLDLQYMILTYDKLDLFFEELKGSGSYLHEVKHQALMGKSAWARLCEAYARNAQGQYAATFELVYGYTRRGDMILRRHRPGEPIHIPVSEIKRT